MSSFSLAELVPILQTAIGPVILISGVGLLLLSMTNRLGRVIDRSRILVHELRESPHVSKDLVSGQIQILAKRANLLQQSIILATVSVLFAAILIIALFLIALFRFEYAWLISTLFIGCLLALILALIFFIQDLNHSLVAFKMDIDEENITVEKAEI